MKLIHKVKTIDVKRCFVVADTISFKADRRKRLRFITREEFKKSLKLAKVKVFKLKESQLDTIISNEYEKRLRAYDDSE